MTTSIKPAWETALRRRIKLPRHYTANDSASVLLRLSALAFFAAAIAFVVAPWFVNITLRPLPSASEGDEIF